MDRERDLFLDLDGVLADFDAQVGALFGRAPDRIPPGVLWGRAAKTPGFFESMPKTPDADELWAFCEPHEPTILTGLPRGTWAGPQKRTWVARHFGVEVPVITCMARDKWSFATPGAVLVDDTTKFAHLWEQTGGVFVQHTSARETIAVLRTLGFGAG
ncbi:MAG: hypothetical protein IT303_10090 [Dehalococcoidia bacterium]|nr:hypothetical protein [Dehalococcoidia bacterium]